MSHSGLRCGLRCLALLASLHLVPAVKLARVVHRVSDPHVCAAFYSKTLGLATVEEKPRVVLAAEADSALRLELVQHDDAGFSPHGGYLGLTARVPDLKAAIATAKAAGGTLLEEASIVEHPPALIPDEDDESKTPIFQAKIADPCGYPVLLYEAGLEANPNPPALCAVRLSVHAWKFSQEYFERACGWSTLRWQSNLPLDASITVTMGDASLAGAIGPCGPVASDSDTSVLQLYYAYDSDVIGHDDGLQSLVIKGGNKACGADPDSYPITFDDDP